MPEGKTRRRRDAETRGGQTRGAAQPGRASFPGAGARPACARATNGTPDVPGYPQTIRRALLPRFLCAGARTAGAKPCVGGLPAPNRRFADRQITQLVQLTYLSRKAFRCRAGRETGQECPSAGLDVPRYAQAPVRRSGARFAAASASKSTLEDPFTTPGGGCARAAQAIHLRRMLRRLRANRAAQNASSRPKSRAGGRCGER